MAQRLTNTVSTPEPGDLADAVARLRAENERLRRQQTALEALWNAGRELSEGLDLDHLFATLQRQLAALTGLDNCWVAFWDDESGLADCRLWVGDGRRAPEHERVGWPEHGLLLALLADRRPLLTDDYAAECARRGIAYGGVLPRDRRRAWFGLPLLVGDRMIGALAVWRWGGRIPPETIAALEPFARQIATAMANARRYEEAREQRRVEEAFSAIARDLATSLDDASALQQIADAARSLLRTTYASIALFEPTTGLLRRVANSSAAAGGATGAVLTPPGEGIVGRVWASGRPFATEDHATDDRLVYSPALRAALAGNTISAALAVPIAHGEERLGTLLVGDRERRRFTPREEAILARLATHAALAVRNARLYAAAQARADRLAMFNEIGRELGGELDLERLLNNAWRHLARIAGVRHGWLGLWDAEAGTIQYCLYVIDGERDPAAEDCRPLGTGTGLSAALITGGATIRAAGYQEECRRRGLLPAGPLPDDQDNPWLGVPLLANGRTIGAMAVWRYDAPFGEEEATLLEALAGQLAAALENARLYREAHARAARLELLNAAGRALSAELDRDRFLEVARHHLLRVVEAEVCWLALWDETAQRLDYRLCLVGGERRREEEYSLALASGRGLAGAIVRERATIQVPDYAAECRRRGLEPVGMAGEQPANAWLGVPLLAGGRIVGAMAARRHGRPFTAEEASSLETLAGQMAATLENARLYQEARQLASTDPLTGLANHRHALARFDEELARAARRGHTLATVMLDLDNFKFFNDTYGHPTGDRILRLVAGALRDEARAADIVARYGGDEFLLILPETDTAGALAIVERLHERLRALRPTDDERCEVPLALSAGIALYPHDARQRQELIALADAALYASKRGVGRTVVTAGTRPAETIAPEARTGFDVVEGLVLAVDAKDHYTLHHSVVVAETAVLLAEALGLPERDRAILHAAGLLHDVGKISIPDRVLRKPGALNDDEWAIMRQHVEFSELIIRGVPGLADFLEPIIHHHERWDGRGYPRGLAGEEVPLLGRIMVVADAYSAMTLDRPYRRGLTVAQAVAQLRAGAGTQFDPALVALLCDRLERDQPDTLTAAS